ncbi:MAG: hypothetical protein JWL89_441 [Candidatus Saccharibacteria bacterium]|nr:hypothetical protein [Candidatus Saccharibacteria bacterium]
MWLVVISIRELSNGGTMKAKVNENGGEPQLEVFPQGISLAIIKRLCSQKTRLPNVKGTPHLHRKHKILIDLLPTGDTATLPEVIESTLESIELTINAFISDETYRGYRTQRRHRRGSNRAKELKRLKKGMSFAQFSPNARP